MQTQLQTRHSTTAQKPRLFLSVPQRAILPRRIAPGVFFVGPPSHGNSDNGNDDAMPSTNTLARLGITHAVVERSSSSSSDHHDRPAAPPAIQALFVGPHDPLSRVVAWMRAVRRRLGAHVIVVGDCAAAAGYLVVELGLTPRSAWLRIARGIPPAGDLVLARLCALAIVHNENEKGKGKEVDDGSTAAGAQAVACASLGEEGRTGCGYRQFSVSPHSRQSARVRARAESGLRHVVVI
jgi:hypothetical protein